MIPHTYGHLIFTGELKPSNEKAKTIQWKKRQHFQQMGPKKICKASVRQKTLSKRQKGHQQIRKGFLPILNLIGD
jgi:hypothetical protein